MTKSQNTKSEQLTEQWKKGELPEGYYTVECNNCIWITFWNGYRFLEDDKALSDLFRKYPVKVKKCFKEVLK